MTIKDNKRDVLSNRRNLETVETNLRGVNFRVSIGRGKSGTVQEIFATCEKLGSEIESLARDVAILISISLQHGVPIISMREAVTRDDSGSAASIAGELIDLVLLEFVEGEA